jgi:hypothetical protein
MGNKTLWPPCTLTQDMGSWRLGYHKRQGICSSTERIWAPQKEYAPRDTYTDIRFLVKREAWARNFCHVWHGRRSQYAADINYSWSRYISQRIAPYGREGNTAAEKQGVQRTQTLRNITRDLRACAGQTGAHILSKCVACYFSHTTSLHVHLLWCLYSMFTYCDVFTVCSLINRTATVTVT